jgi:hypothetical protein
MIVWGDDVMEWNPDRDWHPHELQKSNVPDEPLWSTAVTPCTERFHPFSVPTRDCMGKNFALTEMRILLPSVLRSFKFEIPEGSELRYVKPEENNQVFADWVRGIGGPPQPHHLKLKVTPVAPRSAKM